MTSSRHYGLSCNKEHQTIMGNALLSGRLALHQVTKVQRGITLKSAYTAKVKAG